jgi:hypothetical protein
LCEEFGSIADDHVVFGSTTVELLLHKLSAIPWWVKFAVHTWFQSTIGVHKREVLAIDYPIG